MSDANVTLYSSDRFWEVDGVADIPSLFIYDHPPHSGAAGVTVRVFATVEQLRALRDALAAALPAEGRS